jgi:transposase InsO family protein
MEPHQESVADPVVPLVTDEDVVMDPVEEATAPTLEATMDHTKKELKKTTMLAYQALLVEFKEMVASPDTDEAKLQANVNKQKILLDQLERLEPQEPKVTKIKEVPKNVPILRLPGDKESPKHALTYETIDRFLDLFELVLYQHALLMDHYWEAAFISSVQHSTERCLWFMANLKGKSLTWLEAKKVIKTHFGGNHSQTHYLEKITSMAMSKWEDPLQYVRRFVSDFNDAGVTDSEAYGAILLKSMAANGDLIRQIKTTYASTPVEGRPTLNVNYVARILPQLHMEVADPIRPGNAPAGDGARSRRRNNRDDNPRSNKRVRHDSTHGQGHSAGPSRTGPSRSGSSRPGSSRPSGDDGVKKDPKKTGLCRFCGGKWYDGHRCKEYFETKEAKLAYTARMATLKQTNNKSKGKGKEVDHSFRQDFQDISLTDDDDCKSKQVNKKEKEEKEEKQKTESESFIVPIIVESHKIFALIDSGANFSSLSPSFLHNNKIPITHVDGIINLAHNQRTKRIGYTKPLSVQYNKKQLQVEFEAMRMPSDKYQCVIGTDIFAELGLFFIGLATSFDGPPPFTFDDNEHLDVPAPDNSPAGTDKEQALYLDSIRDSMYNNQTINKKSFCTVEESIVHLPTPAGKTCFKRQYPLPDKLMPIVDEAVKKWFEDGTIVRARINNEWNSPLTLAPKKNADGTKSKKRPCLDPRHINLLLPDDKYPLPLIKDIFAQLKNARVFSTLDLKNAFHRFKIAKEDRHKTTFTHRGIQFMFKGCPFGLKPLSSKFQRVTALLLEDMPFATSFIDDIVVFSNTMDDHAIHVKQVINKLTSVNLILNPDKCHFAQRSVYLLGFCVSEKGLTLDTRKVTNVQDWPVPQTGNDIEKFLGIINYFRDHIPSVSSLTAPLDQLRKEKKLGPKWDKICESAFEKLKLIITRTPIIKVPHTDQPFYVATDASNVGIGAVLFQLNDTKVRHLGFFARALSKSERNYSTTKRELLAVVFALNKFHKFLWGNHFTLFTDHRALIYIHTQKIANPMMIGWLDTILQYNFTVAHIPGMSNVLPDALSRLFPVEKELAGDEDKHQRKVTYKQSKMNKLTKEYATQKKEMRMHSKKEAEEVMHDYFKPDQNDRYGLIRKYHRTATIYSESHMNQPEERYKETIEDLQKRNKALERQHAFGHFGAEAMEKAIHADGMHWPNLRQDAINMVKKCNQCMQYNIGRKGYHPLASITSEAPGDHWAIDLAGEFEQTHRGNVYILVMVDICTKYVLARPIPDKQSSTIAQALVEVFCTFGFPKILQSDNGSEFVNELIRFMMDSIKIDHRLISAYHPRANGAAENSVKNVKARMIKMMEGQTRDWDLYVPTAQLAINAKPSKLTESAPFALMFARKLNDFANYKNVETAPTNKAGPHMMEQRIKDMQDIVLPAIVQRTKKVRDASQKKFDATHKIIDFPVGTLVGLLKPMRTDSMEAKYNGPFTVVKRNKGGAYTLQQRNGELLPKAYPPSALKPLSDEVIKEKEDRWEVQAIVSHRGTPGNYEYKARWKGFTPDDDTWEPAEMFDDVDTIKTYWSKRRLEPDHTQATKKRRIRK